MGQSAPACATIKLDNSMASMDTDIVAQGPLLVGGGIRFTKMGMVR
jgi:hypothetical protein